MPTTVPQECLVFDAARWGPSARGNVADDLEKVARRRKNRRKSGASGCRGLTNTPPGLVHEKQYNYTGNSALGTEMHCQKVWIPFILHGALP